MYGTKTTLIFTLTALIFGSCKSEQDTVTSPSSIVHDIRINPSSSLIVGIGNAIDFTATPIDASNQVVAIPIEWSILDPAIASIDGNGTVKSLKAGTTSVKATAGNQEVSGQIEVWDPPSLDTYISGQRYQGRNGYVEYIPGDLPLILSGPHGGNLCPDEIPDRTYGTIGSCSPTGSDTNTLPLVTTIRSVFFESTGHTPHIILLRLARPKLDANRKIEEAAQGNPFSENTWSEYHGFVDVAKDTISKEFGFGLYMDMHGHGHDIPRIELGYLLSKTDLQTSGLNLPHMIDKSSFKTLSEISLASTPSSTSFTDIIRGPKSLGSLLEERGIRAVPSGPDAAPV
jgi:hypothetical protein